LHTEIVARPDLPDAVFHLLRVAFPDDQDDPRAFWPDDSTHVVVYQAERIVGHAGLITRALYIDGAPHSVAYVEYVAAEPRRSGYGTEAMQTIAREIKRRGFTLAALATGSPSFYQRLGWRPWRGPAGYRDRNGGSVPTPDSHPMVLDLGANVNLDAAIECEWRPGEVW
jgi:aminoglycoside 2'-N-acetyltransferase I